MFYTDAENNIYLTRGDTGIFTISLKDSEGNPYTPQEGDVLRFAMAKRYGVTASDVLINKTFSAEDLTLEIEPQDTKSLQFGDYVYNIELVDTEGHVSTVILARFKLTNEVY